MLSVNTNTSSLSAQNKLLQSSRNMSVRFERLSSGLRVNGAKDDAAGLSISTRMTAQVRGVQKSIQNSNDNISMLQTAEGALDEVTNILQRMRQLAVQASSNGVLNTSDKESIQAELDQLGAELNRINETTTFNARKVFSQHKTISTGTDHAKATGFETTYDMSRANAGNGSGGQIATNMKQSWLRESVDRIERYYGITSEDGWELTVAFTVSGDDFGGVMSGHTLSFNLAKVDASKESGFVTAIHEITHGVMSSAGVTHSRWWNEGTAQFMENGDLAITNELDNGATVSDIADAVGDLATWTTGLQREYYAASYAATWYLHDAIKDQGHSDGIASLMREFKSSGNFDHALRVTSGFSSESAFLTAFEEVAEDYITNELDLNNDDIGIIGGHDADKGEITTMQNIISHVAMFEEDKAGGVDVKMHIGPNGSDTLAMKVGAFNTHALNLEGEGVNVMRRANTESLLVNLDAAIDYVSAQRSQLGAMQNRLSSTVSSLSVNLETTSASRSRILDADFAQETSMLATAQVIQRASVSILAQANSSNGIALSLL